jgi:RecA/RadA recombinase
MSKGVKAVSKSPPDPIEVQPFEGYFDSTVSTGSTLLDLAISGSRVRGGGIPGGILLEIYGPSQTGKTAILAELCASAQVRGGDMVFLDPEARLDKDYSRTYGVSINKDNYARPDTVTEIFDYIYKWKPKPKKEHDICVVANDSLAALSTELEMTEGDSMGMRRGKEFSQGLRKTCRIIKNNNWVIACSNQIRHGTLGEFTPGGFGIPFYASLRMRAKFAQEKFLTKTVKFHGRDIEKTIGNRVIVEVKKSSVDDPYRSAEVHIIYKYGIDDIRANLIYCKKMLGDTKFDCFDKEYVLTQRAVEYIEKQNYEDRLREKTIDIWEEIENKFAVKRKPKVRI